ncbi:MAG: Hpt domain-containing protein [Candidatus Micrarchaeota archaeon]
MGKKNLKDAKHKPRGLDDKGKTAQKAHLKDERMPSKRINGSEHEQDKQQKDGGIHSKHHETDGHVQIKEQTGKNQPRERSHLPIHEQIKKQLQGKTKREEPRRIKAGKAHAKEEKKLDGETPHKKTGGPELKAGSAVPSPKESVHTEIEAKARELAMSYFEISMMDKVEIEANGKDVKLRITGSLGLEKLVSVDKGEVARFLGEVLPKRISAMEPGEKLDIVGMEMDELEDLFRTSIPVEPRGELEVSEKEEGGKVSITIKVAKAKEPLFDYSKPGLEDVRRLVEREKLAIGAAQKTPEEKGEAKEEPDWLQEQLAAQKRDIAALAKEFGEKVKPPEEKGEEAVPKEEPPQATSAAPPESQSTAPTEPQAQASPSASEESPGEPAQAQAPAGGGEDSMNMTEFMDAYKEEAAAFVEALKKIPRIKENPGNADLIAEMQRSAHGLKSMSAAMGFMNISKISKALEMMFAGYKKTGTVDMAKFDVAKEAVDKIDLLYSDLANSEKANVDEVVKKVEAATPS